jgi:arylsulfatase A-like enzyme
VPGHGDEEKLKKNLAGYYAHCSALDHCVGRLVEKLKALDLWDDTIRVFTSDHGDMCTLIARWRL